MKANENPDKTKIIKEITELGVSEKQAAEMVEVFFTHGGLAAHSRWPGWFSMCSPQTNVCDVLLKNGVF